MLLGTVTRGSALVGGDYSRKESELGVSGKVNSFFGNQG